MTSMLSISMWRPVRFVGVPAVQSCGTELRAYGRNFASVAAVAGLSLPSIDAREQHTPEFGAVFRV